MVCQLMMYSNVIVDITVKEFDDLPTDCRAAAITHVQFLARNVCHTKRFSDSQEKGDVSQEKREMSRERRDSSCEKQDERW